MSTLIIPRRAFVLSGLALIPCTPALATVPQVASLIQALTGGADRPGRVRLDLPLLVENGNAVSMTVTGPAGTSSLHVFAEGNPNPEVIVVRFGPASGQPRLATRIRLSTSQTVTAVAVLADGTFWTDRVELIVTLAACLE